MSKPIVFKMGGAWIWLCHDHIGGPVGDTFPESGWRSPWDACIAAATKHAVFMHDRDDHTVLPGS